VVFGYGGRGLGAQYEFEPLTTAEAAHWDGLIAPYPDRELFHCKVWLDYLAASRGVEIRFWAIREGSQTIGYFCGGVLRKGPFRILGSPLKGWGTNFMGPVLNSASAHDKLLTAMDSLAAAEHLAMIELEYRGAPEEAYGAADYEPVRSWTFLVNLVPGDSDAMWQALDSTCRNRIRKAMKAELTFEDSDDPAIADEFYDQYTDLMRHKGLVPSYPRHHPRLLFQYLKKADLLFALRIRDKTGRILATGLFPHDDRTMYFWGGASWQAGRQLCPNEFLHWSAMTLAAKRGLLTYNTCGHGQFKSKFGGALLELKRWHKCYWRTARWARRGYEVYFQNQIRLRGWWKRAAHRRGGES
jgi:hypothetical protein